MRKIVVLFLIIAAIIYALKSLDDSLSNKVNNLAASIDIDKAIPSKLSVPKKIEKPEVPPVVENKEVSVPPAKIAQTSSIEAQMPPVAEPPVRETTPLEDGKKMAQPGQEVICDTFIPRCVNFQYFFKDIPQEMWDQPVSCLTRLSNCIDKGKYEIPSDDEIVSIYQAPSNDLDYQEYLKKKRKDRGEIVEEYSY